MKQSATSISKDFPIFFFGGDRFLCIDLKQFKNKEIIEDLLDIAEIETHKGEPAKPLREIIEKKKEELMYSVIIGNSAEKMLDKLPNDYY